MLELNHSHLDLDKHIKAILRSLEVSSRLSMPDRTCNITEIKDFLAIVLAISGET